MAVAKQESTNDKKKTTSQTQTVSVGGRDVKVQTPKAKYENTAKTTTSGPSVGGRDLSKKQAESSITKPYYDNKKQISAPSTRNDFSSDRDYERYLLDNKVDFTKGDARDYLKQKASESGTTSMDYMQGMRQRYKNQNDTELVRQKIGNGEISQQSAEEINNRYGALLDENGNEVDIDKYNNDVELVTKTAEELNKQIDKLNKDYTSGKIDYETLQAENDRIHKLWEENASMGERLNSYSTVQGFDYYDWAKANGKDVTDFEAYVENFNDTFPERLAQEYASSWWDTLNILPDTYNVLRQIADPNYDASKDVVGSMSEKIKQTSLELRDYAYAGATPVSQWSLQCLGSLMPMINSMMIGSLMPVNAETFTNVTLGLQSGAETTRQRLEEGVEPGLALMNGILHGVITGLVEGLNAGAVTELITGAPGKWLASLGMFEYAGPVAIAKYMGATAISEGAEEVIETLADHVADQAQNLIYGSLTGNTLEATGLDIGDMTNQFIMASIGTVALGGLSGASIMIDSKKKYNSAINARAHFESVLGDPLATEEEVDIARKGIVFINEQIKPFEGTSQTAMAVELATDSVKPAPTFNEMMNNLANAIQPDVSSELSRAQQTLDYAKEMEGNLQQALLERNVIMPANQYMNMDEKTRHEYLELAKAMEENGRPAIFMDLGDGINGYNSPNGTIINTNQSRTIDVDDLVNMDEKTFQDLMKNDPNQIFEDAGADASAVTSASHEFTHFAEISGQWNALRDYVREQMGAKKFFLLEKRIGDIYKARGINDADVEHEAVAYYVQKNMGSLDFLRRMASYNSSFFNRLTTKAQNFFNDDAQARMETAFMDAFRDAQDKLETAGTPAYSIGSVFQAVNMTIEKNGDMIEAYVNGEKVDEVTFEHVRDSALGNLMRMSVNNGFLTKDQAYDQMKMYADMLNTVLRTQDPDLLWAISGSLGYQQVKDGTVIDETKSTKSSAFTSNADKQYNRTFDVTTICNKTQQIINVMSSVMMKLDRGLTEAEIVKVIYDETNKAGEPVPCPVCYVFSRWVGVGGLLDNIKNYQIEYENVDINDLRKRYNALSRQVDEIVKRENIDITSETDEDTDEKTKKKIKGTKAREILDKQLNAEYNALLGRQNTFMLMGKELSQKDKQRLSDLEKDMAIMDRWSWIGKVRLSANYKPVPHDVLFDMNKGEEFANDYPETWSYRTTRGPAMGKAITPYTSEVLGQTIMGFSGSPSNMKKLGERRSVKNNPFLKSNETKPMASYFEKAVKNARAQNLIGGSRAQSTSDFRFEYVLDYLLHFMELQAIHSYGQTYTKVPEAVPLLASVGYEVNMSLMAKEFGFKEVAPNSKNAFECTWDSENMEKGKWYTLDFSNVTGMNAEDAFRLATMFDNAQPIIVGINDDHMRLCMADPRITFIIPYHASGANEQRYVDLMRAVGEEVPGKARRDYSKMQNDTEIENPTSQQKRFRKARLDIIMGKATKETRKAVEGNKILENLYDRFYIQGVDPDCFHNFLKKDQAKQIFPYEYWDKTTTIDTADRNGKLFVDYCEALGMVPRFEEFSGEDGYWKMLIDRSMYGLDGNYRDQRAINLDDFNTDYLFRNKMVEGIIQPSQVMDASKTEGIVDNSIRRIENVQYSLGAWKGISNLHQHVLNNPNSKYKELYDKMTERENTANDMFMERDENGNRKYTFNEIYDKTGWLFDENDGYFKAEFYDDGSVDKIADYVMNHNGVGTGWNSYKFVKKQPTFEDILGADDLLMVMYPDLRKVHFYVTQRAPVENGRYSSGWFQKWSDGTRSLLVAKRLLPNGRDFSINNLRNTIAHELQHFIQEQENFEESPSNVPYEDKIEEKEAFKEGDKQENIALRKVDNYGNMIVDDRTEDAGIPEEIDDGDVEVDEPAEGMADVGEEGELEPGDEVSEGEDTAGENSEPDSEPTVEPEPEEETVPEEEEENLTDNIDDDGEEDEDEPASIKRGGPDFKKTTWKDFVRWVKHRIGDHLDAVEELARKTKNKKIIAKADTAMNFRAIANMAILNGRYELLSKNGQKIGDSLSSILDMVPKDSQEDFDYYMYNYRNMDSTSMRERLGLEYLTKKYLEGSPMYMPDGTKVTPEQLAQTIEDMEKTMNADELENNPVYKAFNEFSKPKYVFGSSKIGYAESKKIVEQMESEHPEFKAIAEKIWEYGRQDLKVLQETGIIDQDAYDLFLKETPHYVPIARDIDKAKFEGKYKLDPNKALRRFKGSKIDMWSLEYAMINHTYNVYKTALTNNLHQEIYNTLKPKKQGNVSNENVEDIVSDNHAHVEKMKDGTYRMYAYINGKRKMVKVDENLYNSLTPRQMGMTVPAFATLSELRRNLITSWNPVFYATNAIKDVQDALYNTKYPWRFVPNYIRAWNQIRTNGEYKQMYLRNGGAENSYMHELSKKDVGFNPLKRIIQVGDAIELAPRLAEFISSIESGNSVEEAMYDSAEVTTNFKRGGELAKTINRNGVTFFNASVQGFNKQIRNWKDAGSNGAVGLLTYMARTALISGIPLYLLNSLAWKDDDDYEELSDYIKENYYIIWKTGNRFIRIPKGRLASFYQTVMTQAKTVEDQVTLWNAFMKVIKSGIDNIAPNNPADNFLGSPLIQAFGSENGKTWYGEELVPSRLQKLPDAEQYDYSTDIISKFVGEKLNISPYKINYVLDQYSGGIGDIGLPMFMLQADSGVDNKLLAGLMAPVLDKFTTDPVMKKQCVSTFYELKDELEKLKNSKNATNEDILAYKYISNVSSEMGELYKKMREIQSQTGIPNSKKYEDVRNTKELINQWAQIALASYDSIDIHGSYAEVGGVKYRVDKQGEWRKMSEQTVKKMEEYNLDKDQTGKYYENVYDIDSAREDIKAKTPEGQNADYREVTVSKIRSSNADAKTKNAMFDSYYSGKFTDAINSMDFDDETKLEIKYAKTLANSEKDANGKTVSGSKAKAVAKEYERLGVLGDIIDYIKSNDIDPSTMGLSKAIVNGYKGSNSKSSSSKKSSSSRSKKASSGGSSGGGGSGIRSAGKLNKLGPVTSKSLINDKKIANGATNYMKAYASVFNRSGKKPSTGGSSGSVTCPRCGSSVSSSNGKCPVCGANL